jgi:hypothetical protein
MAGQVQEANLTTRNARKKLKRGRQPHWHALIANKAALGYQIREQDREGRWLCVPKT